MTQLSRLRSILEGRSHALGRKTALFASILTVTVLCGASVRAAEDIGHPRVAPEFTVTNLTINPERSLDDIDRNAVKAMVLNWIEVTKAMCKEDPDCERVDVKMDDNGFDTKGVYFKILFRDGVHISVTPDHGVFEIKILWQKPSWWQTHQDRIQHFVFDSAADPKVGLRPNLGVGMGHITHELSSTFGDNVFLLRQYIADRFNHPELATGIFENDWTNAQPLNALSAEGRRNLMAILAEVDGGQITQMADFIKRLRQMDEFREKHFELAIRDNAVEDRAVRAQRNAGEFNLLVDLKLARIEFLKTVAAPIALREVLAGRLKLPAEEAVARFRSYTDEAHKNFASYQVFLSDEWRLSPEVQRILRDELSLATIVIPFGVGAQIPLTDWKSSILENPALSLSQKLAATVSATEMLEVFRHYADSASSLEILRQRVHEIHETTQDPQVHADFMRKHPGFDEDQEFSSFGGLPVDYLRIRQRQFKNAKCESALTKGPRGLGKWFGWGK